MTVQTFVSEPILLNHLLHTRIAQPMLTPCPEVRVALRARYCSPSDTASRYLSGSVKTGYNTRARAHNFVLPPKDNSNCLPRMLYIDIY